MSQYSEICPDYQENHQFMPVLPMRPGDISLRCPVLPRQSHVAF